MERSMSSKDGGEPNPVDSTGLCLLSLDGGGVRGLSTLYILKNIMDRLNYERKKTADLPPLRPCELFDLIGGTSTGGLIAIMLGRLEMDVDECIAAYSELAEAVFGGKINSLPFNLKGKVKSRFDSAKLEKAVQKVVQSSTSGTDLFNDGTERGCRTFVCTVDHDTKDIVRLRSYSLPDEPNIRATICEAALATSAATTFFGAVHIGDRTFADGGLGANNPVDEVEGEASNIWCSETGDLKPLVKCFLSIGTGNPGKRAFEDSMAKFLSQTVVQLVTETENTEKKFVAKWAKHLDEKRYYRFNVDQGLQNVGLDEYKKKGAIEAATEGYLTHMAQKFRVRDCIQNLRLKQNNTETSFGAAVNEYTVRSIHSHKGHHDNNRYIRLPQRSPHFTGRAEELKKMKHLLIDNISALQRRVVIWGVGGAGKTALAAHYAAMNESLYSAIFCINATDAASLRRDCVTIAKCIGLPEALRDPANGPGDVYAIDAVVSAVKDWLTDHPVGDWLLIVDDANNLDKIDLNKYLPSTSGGHVIITSQSKQASGFGPSIPLGELLQEDAQELFLKRSGIGDPTSHQQKLCKDIVTQLGRLALAVEHAAAYVHSSDMPLPEYLESLSRSLHSCLQYSPPDSIHKRTVQATVWMACSAIHRRSLKAAILLSLLGVLDHQSILEEFLLLPESLEILRKWQTISDRDDYFAVKRVLLSFSLIKSESLQGNATISMHTLVHSSIQVQLSLVWRWNWLFRCAVLLRRTAESKQLGDTNFAHIRVVFRSSAKLFQQPNHGQSPNRLWILLAEATYKYRVYWQVQGLMQELNDLSKIVIKALEDDSDSNRIMRALVVSVRILTVQFTNLPETPESVLHEFLIEQMTPQTANLMRRIHGMAQLRNVAESFHPYSLVDVFQKPSYAPYLDLLVNFLRRAVILYSGQVGKVGLASAYLHLSQLPRTESWKTQLRRTLGTASSLTRPITDATDQLDLTQWAAIAAQDRLSGSLGSTMKLLRHVTEIGKPRSMVGGFLFEAAVYDLAKILRKLKCDDEAAIVLQKLECPGSKNSEVEIARRYQDFYIWARKAYLAADLHVSHHRTEDLLKETHEAARKVFGKISLSTLHAGWLLEKFYSQPCCYSAEMVTRFKEETDSGFSELYSGEFLRRAERLQVGKILLAQGALEEAVWVLDLFAAEANRELGTTDPLTENAKRWAAIAQRDKILEEREEVAGKASFEWGSMCFSRTLSDLNDLKGLEDKD